jgi:hypothetical protein
MLFRNANGSKGLGAGSNGNSSRGSWNNNTDKKSAEYRVNSSSQRSFKSKKPAATKLSRGTLKSLEDMDTRHKESWLEYTGHVGTSFHLLRLLKSNLWIYGSQLNQEFLGWYVFRRLPPIR